MNALVACEESQRVTMALRDLGVNAFSCDLIACSGGHPEWHIQGDALPLIDGKCTFTTMGGDVHSIDGTWDLLIAHPPCTYLAVAGAKHLYRGHVLNKARYAKGLEAKAFLMRFLNADCKHIAVENPTPMKVFELPPPSQVIQPYQFGHPFSKRTCLWLKNLPPLVPTEILNDWQSTRKAGNWFNHGGKERQRERAKTFPGIAQAMGRQWVAAIWMEELN